ncbi:hypothetical protein PUV54_06180 [Hyphococcus flavus]|uniref:LPS-assembly lipoprotein n=1 Tax=Hyphococcus flavus TaxID=1866326 RepID=A0AAE9ZD37_9PROT|nr:hypothetical protein [Hyphococcus flavus]WDI32783.1 hypothetical protein PUV54_06180 [Hyphococcus flavus]
MSWRILAACAFFVLLPACGFQPIYATQEGSAPVIRQVEVVSIAAPESLVSTLTDALNARMPPQRGVEQRYALYLQTRERAERLAVQIDATVTRYNYRLIGRYTVLDRETGERFRGVARAVTSYNIVSSQYSTLFAERKAVEKAAQQLSEEIERDLLIRFAEPPENRSDLDPEQLDAEFDDSVILVDPRRGEVIKPLDDDQ